jgi:hypothetical protein
MMRLVVHSELIDLASQLFVQLGQPADPRNVSARFVMVGRDPSVP